MNEFEEWRPITGWDGRYEVSNMGRVRTWFERIGSTVVRSQEPKILSQNLGGAKRQYRRVTFYTHSKYQSRYVHQLVLESFVGQRPEKHQASHEDGVGSNNRIDNLSWKTVIDNHADKKRHGTQTFGERHPNSHLTEDQVIYILNDNRKTPGLRLARIFGVNHKTVYAILNGKTWRHLRERRS